MNEINQIVEAVVSKLNTSTLNLEKAKALISQCEEKANSINISVTITVIDAGGNLIAQHRMDDALLASINVSFAKAFTALSLRKPTHLLSDEILPGKPLYSLQNTNNNYCFLGGGFPILSGSTVIGALGVSGGTLEEDVLIANSVL